MASNWLSAEPLALELPVLDEPPFPQAPKTKIPVNTTSAPNNFFIKNAPLQNKYLCNIIFLYSEYIHNSTE
jgi:hypothetical protein